MIIHPKKLQGKWELSGHTENTWRQVNLPSVVICQAPLVGITYIHFRQYRE
jgi:hypothetical protein